MKPSSARPVLAVDATRMARDRTGIETYLHHVLPTMVRVWRNPPGPGFAPGDVTVFARDPAVVGHVSPPPVVVPSRNRAWTQVALPGALRRAGAAIYFSPIPVLPVIARMPCPAVVTVHDFHEFEPWWYYRRLLHRTLSIASGIVCVSQATHHELVDRFPDAAAKSVVVREGADPNLFHPAPAGAEADQSAVLARHGIDRPPLLAVGTIQPRKNYAGLIRAYARLPAEATPPLLIVGRPGWDFEEVMALPEQLGITGRVVFAGHLPETEVAELLRVSMMLCAVSTGEGFGLPIVEAMFSGLPIVASDIPPFREVAGNAARFVNPLSVDDIAAGISTLIQNPAARQEMAQVGLGRRGLFDWETAANAIVDLLRRSLTSV